MVFKKCEYKHSVKFVWLSIGIYGFEKLVHQKIKNRFCVKITVFPGTFVTFKLYFIDINYLFIINYLILTSQIHQLDSFSYQAMLRKLKIEAFFQLHIIMNIDTPKQIVILKKHPINNNKLGIKLNQVNIAPLRIITSRILYVISLVQ